MERSRFFTGVSVGELYQAAQIGGPLVRTKALYALRARDAAMTAGGSVQAGGTGDHMGGEGGERGRGRPCIEILVGMLLTVCGRHAWRAA